jgi:hypothetical protein
LGHSGTIRPRSTRWQQGAGFANRRRQGIVCSGAPCKANVIRIANL